MRTEPRLDLLLPDLAHRLIALTPERQRQLAGDVVDLAVNRCPIEDPRYESANTALRAGQYGESSERRQLAALVAELDEVQWDMQERVDNDLLEPGEQHRAFATARAANALWCALDDDPCWALLEATYESYAALDEDETALSTCAAQYERGS